MKKLLLLLQILLFSRAFAQSPQISYRVTPKDTIGNCYEVYFKSSENLKNQIIMDYTITIVAPEEWGNRIKEYSSPNGQIKMELLSSFKKGGKGLDYLYFYSQEPFKVTMGQEEEKLLFSFCADGPCGEPLRLIRGLSPMAKNTYTNNAMDGADGPLVDLMPENLDFANSMNLFYNSQVYESYYGINYGSVLSCPTNYELQKSTNKTLVNISTDSKFSYTINLINGITQINKTVILQDTLQIGQTFESIQTPNGWSCTQTDVAPVIITCQNTSPILSSSTNKFIINVKASQETILKNQAFAREEGKGIVSSNIVQITTNKSPCVENLIVDGIGNEANYSGLTFSKTPFEQANSSVTSNLKTTIDSTTVNYRAGKALIFTPGFSITIKPTQGSFSAEIGGCK